MNPFDLLGQRHCAQYLKNLANRTEDKVNIIELSRQSNRHRVVKPSTSIGNVERMNPFDFPDQRTK